MEITAGKEREFGRGRGRVESLKIRELTCKERWCWQTHAPVSSSRVSPRQGKEFGRFVSDPGLAGSPIRVHSRRPVSRHAVNVTTGPLRASLARDGLASRCSVVWRIHLLRGSYILSKSTAITRPGSCADLDCIAPSPPQPSCRVLSVGFHTKFLTTRVRGGCLSWVFLAGSSKQIRRRGAP